jgi:hypothetical protein
VCAGESFSFTDTYNKSYNSILANSVLWLCAAGDIYDGGKIYQVTTVPHDLCASPASSFWLTKKTGCFASFSPSEHVTDSTVRFRRRWSMAPSRWSRTSPTTRAAM